MTITVASRGYEEEEILREIYAGSLEAAGFEVERRRGPGVPSEELEKGLISGYPEHLDSALIEIGSMDPEAVPGQVKAAYRATKRQLGPNGLIALPPSSFARSKVIGISEKTADEGNVKTLSDLERLASEMNAAGGEYFCYCHGRACLSGLEQAGVVFEGFSLMEPAARLRRELRKGGTDAAVFFATDGRLAREADWLVLLEDTEHRLPAANAFWLTTQEVIDEAGPDYEKAILEAQKGLTLEIMRGLDAKVELEDMEPAEVAAQYLSQVDRP